MVLGAVGLISVVSATVPASAQTVAKLDNFIFGCMAAQEAPTEIENRYDAGYCVGVISGLMTSMQLHCLSRSSGATPIPSMTMRQGNIGVEEAVAAVVSFYSANRDGLDTKLEPSGLAMVALSELFPCQF